MPNLAGFDVIIELAVDTLADIVDSSPVTIPLTGRSVYLLSGKFSLDLLVPVPPFGSGQFRLFCTATMTGLTGTPNCQIDLVISDGSGSLGPTILSQIGGHVTVIATVVFIPSPAPGAPANSIVPGVNLSASSSTVLLDGPTQGRINGALGSSGATAFSAALNTALQAWLNTLPTTTSGQIGLTLVPGVDSNSPLQLSAMPTPMWIDAATLGIFGYYRKEASGGTATAKVDSDIVQTSEEFLYNQPGLFSAVPTRRTAVVLSPDGFRLTVGCPAVRSLVRGFVAKLNRGRVLDAMRSVYGSLLQTEENANYPALENAEWVKDGSRGPVTNDQRNRAHQKVQAAIDARLAALTDAGLNAWLDSADGQAAITAGTPGPCGNGQVEIDRQYLPDPIAGHVATILTQLKMVPGNGHLDLTVSASGDAPVCGSFDATLPATLSLPVDYRGAVGTLVAMGTPDTHVHVDLLCKLVVGYLLGLVAGPVYGSALSLLGFEAGISLAEKLMAQIVSDKVPTAPKIPVLDMPSGTQLKDIKIETSGVTVLALVARSVRFNDFRPRVTVVAKQVSAVPSAQLLATVGQMAVKATKWGCEAAIFLYEESFNDTAFDVRLEATDIPLPVRIDGWWLETGSPLDSVDPRPYWSGDVQPIAAPQVAAEATVQFPDPPIKGRWERRPAVDVDVSGTPAAGWVLGFKAPEGNFYVKVSVRLTDGAGTQQQGETFFHVVGQSIAFGDDYLQWKADCDDKWRRYWTILLATMHLTQVAEQVAHGGPVEDREAMVSLAMRELIRAGDATALSRLEQAMAEGGKRFATAFAGLPAALGSASAIHLSR